MMGLPSPILERRRLLDIYFTSPDGSSLSFSGRRIPRAAGAALA